MHSPTTREKLVDELMNDSKGEPTQREAQVHLKVGSKNTAQAWIDQFYKRMTKRLLTLLTKKHMKDRVDYCDEHYDSDHDDAAHGDEKMFVLNKCQRKFKYVRHDTDTPAYQFVDDKLHSAQLMVTGVVCRPYVNKKGEMVCDGKLALFRSGGYLYKAKKKSKNHTAGEMYWRDDTVDGVMYEKKIRELVLPELRKAAKARGRSSFKFQDDNAKPHTKAWDKLGLDKAAGKKVKGVHVVRQRQSARSPDLNVLDLYVWGVLQAGVTKRHPIGIEALWKAIQASWDEDLTADKLECAYRLLDPVMALIYNVNGANNFRLCRTRASGNRCARMAGKSERVRCVVWCNRAWGGSIVHTSTHTRWHAPGSSTGGARRT